MLFRSGFIHDNMAYIVDCFEIPDHLLHYLKKRKIDLLILDCLQQAKHSTHLTVEKSFDYIKAIAPKKCGLIHMGHDLSHTQLQKLAFDQFGERVFPLYDQLKLFY